MLESGSWEAAEDERRWKRPPAEDVDVVRWWRKLGRMDEAPIGGREGPGDVARSWVGVGPEWTIVAGRLILS